MQRSIMHPSAASTIRANLLGPILDALTARGHDTSPLLRKHSLPSVQPIDPYQLISLARYVAFFEQAAAVLGDPYLGLRLGRAFQPNLLGPLGFMFQAAADLRHALEHLSAYVSVWQSGTHLELVCGANTAAFVYQIDDPMLRPRRQDAEYSMASLCSLIRNRLGDKWAPLEVHFEHAASPACHRADRVYAQAFHAPVYFGQNLNRLVLCPADLLRAGAASDRSMLPFMERHLRDLARESREADSLSGQVNHQIARRLGLGPITLPAIAAELGLPQRSLQRRLEEEGTSFRSLVRQQRRSIAEALIGNQETSVTAVAHTVGYAETAVLSRAFKSWTGASPRTYARSNRSAV
jgi:AraC-like DNA-binding protein